MITKTEILKQLNKFDGCGRPVIVHTSLRAIGKIEGGADTLLDSLIEHFTKNDGILCVPTHTWDKLVLDLNKKETCLGVLPKVALDKCGGTRSLHPTHSMVVFGRDERVKEFVKNEAFSNSPTSPDGCYGNIFKECGYILLIGVGQEKNTCIHCVDEMLDIPNRLTDEGIYASVIDENGIETKRHLRWFDSVIDDVSVNFGKFETPFRYFNAILDGVLGNANMQFCSSVKIKEVLTLIYKNSEGEELLADNNPLDKNLYEVY